MTDEELREFEEENWARVPEDTRRRCVEHLRMRIMDGGQSSEAWLQAMEEPGFHFFTGRLVRNTLREVLKDEELPLVGYPDGRAYKNWDDFYMPALREALA